MFFKTANSVRIQKRPKSQTEHVFVQFLQPTKHRNHKIKTQKLKNSKKLPPPFFAKHRPPPYVLITLHILKFTKFLKMCKNQTKRAKITKNANQGEFQDFYKFILYMIFEFFSRKQPLSKQQFAGNHIQSESVKPGSPLQLTFLSVSLKNDSLGLKMKVLKFLGH